MVAQCYKNGDLAFAIAATIEAAWPMRTIDVPRMSTSRSIIFWIATFAALTAIIILLRQVLLPFVAGMVLAYLLDPLANRIERLGVNRAVATLAIIAFAVALITAIIILTVPTIIRELSHFVERFPFYVRRVHTLATDPDRPWLSKIVGEGLGETERSISELTKFASGWATASSGRSGRGDEL